MKISRFHSAKEFIGLFDPSDEAKPLLDKTLSAQNQIKALVRAGCLNDAIKIMALCLPKREGAWWAFKAIEYAVPELDEQEKEALEYARQWAIKPSEEIRLKAAALAEQLPSASAAQWPARAVGWSGGNLGSGEEEIPPPDELSHHAVACAVLLAANANPEQEEWAMKFVHQGAEILSGGRGEIKEELNQWANQPQD